MLPIPVPQAQPASKSNVLAKVLALRFLDALTTRHLMSLSREFCLTTVPNILAPQLQFANSRWTAFEPNSLILSAEFEYLTVELQPTAELKELDVNKLSKLF